MFIATIQGRIGSTVLFAGAVPLTARAPGSPAPSQPIPIPVSYVGPGKGVASLIIAPRDYCSSAVGPYMFGSGTSFRRKYTESCPR